MKGKKWLAAWIAVSALILGILSAPIIYVDPYFHYHKPHSDKFYYRLYNQRSINNGIEKHFDYDAMITGTSMTGNFRTSELDELFGTNSIKVTFDGASYYEVNNNIAVAIDNNPQLRMVVRCLDTMMYFDEKDKMRRDLGKYPEYLYDKNIFNDVNYVFNRELLFTSVYQMIMENIKEARTPGIDNFDDYSSWYQSYLFGVNELYPDKQVDLSKKGEPIHISDEERKLVLENIEANVCSLARENPDIQFYYFIPPYSVAWWQQLNESGEIYKYLEAERIVIEQILACENIKLFSASTEAEITTDLNNYKDNTHYGPWINSLILAFMKEDKFLLTRDNYENYLTDLEKLFQEFDYNSVLLQEDYSDDTLVVGNLEALYGCKLGDYSS